MTPAQHAERAEEITAELQGDSPAARYVRDVPALSVAVAQVHALLAIGGQIADLGGSLEMAARLMADHPPVPEQAATAAQAGWVAECAPLWAGWQPGFWPVPNPVDPRGYRWADPLAAP